MRIYLAGLMVFVGIGIFLVDARSAVMAAEYPWRLRVNKQDIEVYTRPVDGSTTLEFKAQAIIAAPVSRVIAVFEDVNLMPAWFHQCTAATLISREDENSKIVHLVMHLPWPVTERDCVYRINRSGDLTQGALTYTVMAVPEMAPADNARIRVPYLKGTWRFTALSDGKTAVYFQQHSDPGGSIPSFISNSIVVEMPFNSLKNLKTLLLK